MAPNWAAALCTRVAKPKQASAERADAGRKGGRAQSGPPSSGPCARRREGGVAHGTGPPAGQARKGSEAGQRKHGPSVQNEREEVFLLFILFSFISKHFSNSFQKHLNLF